MLECVLFDLDNTLLYMDQEKFVGAYFECLSGYMARHGGYEPRRLVNTVLAGTKSMLLNDGKAFNHELFWSRFAAEYGEAAVADKRRFDKFYEKKFDGLSGLCAPIPGAAETVARLNDRGIKTVLASNPVFPFVAMKKRAEWAGVDTSVFARVTSFENSRYCKPNKGYYAQIAEELGIAPENCLMVGNDVGDDMPARAAGMKVFLMPQYIINTENADISGFEQGGFKELSDYIEKNA